MGFKLDNIIAVVVDSNQLYTNTDTNTIYTR